MNANAREISHGFGAAAGPSHAHRGGTAQVLIARSLRSALARLTAAGQAQVHRFIELFQENPQHPSVQLERVERARSEGVWAGRASSDLRVILYRDAGVWAVLYADHHNAAYDWARRREIGRHSCTGALQIVTVVETVREIQEVVKVARRARTPALFAEYADDYLLSLGVPASWMPTLRHVRDDDQLLVVCEGLPPDVADRLMSLATGDIVTPPAPVHPDAPVTDAPDVHPQFCVVSDADELSAALAAPMEQWIHFLHPSQRALVERRFSGPAKVCGAAGTGKTVVAMHRARHLARQGERVFLTSYVRTLTDNIERSLRLLCTPEERSRITVATIHSQALELIHRVEPSVTTVADDVVLPMLENLRLAHAPRWDAAFVRAEWEGVVRPQGLASLDAYRRASRPGRSRSLTAGERETLWKVFGGALQALAHSRMLDMPGIPLRATELLAHARVQSPFTAVIVDEVQDLRPPELRFLSALCAGHPGNLMLCGDAGQRIYPGGFSLGALGIDVRGRSSVLRVSYRMTEQIRRAADHVRGALADDMDGGREDAKGTRSVLRGPAPRLVGFRSRAEELAAAVNQIRAWLARGLSGSAIGVLARTAAPVITLRRMLTEARIPWRRLDERGDSDPAAVSVDIMPLAKGLEFKAVLVLDAGADQIPHPSAFAGVEPEEHADAEERERQLLYVAMTRARDELVVSWSGSPSSLLAALPPPR